MEALKRSEKNCNIYVSVPGGGSLVLARLTLRIAARLKPCCGEMRLVIPPGERQELQPRTNATLIKALTRAH